MRRVTRRLSTPVRRVGPHIVWLGAGLFKEKEEVNPFPFRAIAAGSQLIQQLEAINLKFDEAFNKHDAAAVGTLGKGGPAPPSAPTGPGSTRRYPAGSLPTLPRPGPARLPTVPTGRIFF